ncbi:HTH-type transcriptional regulator McbR [Anaerotignum neopropionicum]|uniref:HTH-type transcriptional regulator McbR n=1 Tax=Anaerotignum neopropionicum TaxID=36847 RepID=A0A136WDC7_9FIRM|nr:GntR family transcriptional regulator [Anaerotignum neopropionicum]KXL52522.1 HTH-type transcriptional regulator McbR [Anaerotignum neopropionicum]
MEQEESLLDYAFREIRTRIQNGTYPPGSKLSTQEISDSLGISRTPVVSAINRLVAQGLAIALPRRGVIVADFSPQQLKEIIEVREMFELYAVKGAIKNADFSQEILDEMEQVAAELASIDSQNYNLATELEIRFHTLFVSLAGNSQLTKLYINNWNIGSMFQIFMLSKMPLSRHQPSFDQHIEMLQLLKDKNETALLAFIPYHLTPVYGAIEWIMRNGNMDMQDLFKIMAAKAEEKKIH